MAREAGIWVEVSEFPEANTIVRPFSSEVAALRSAVKRANGVLFVPFGMTGAEAIAAAEDNPTEPAVRAPRKSRVKSPAEPPTVEDLS